MNNKKEVVVLGAGIGGLSAGYFLARTGKYRVTVIEKELVIGGMCSSFEHKGFILDYGPHKLYSVIPEMLDEIKNVLDNRLIRLLKKNRLFLRGHLLDYPLRLGNLTQALGPAVFLQLGLGYIGAFLKGIFNKGNEAYSYEEYVVKRFGRPAYELVFGPLADKVWGSPESLHPEMAKTRIPASGGFEVILKLLKIKKDTAQTSADFFYYPSKGFGDFPYALKEQIEAMGGKVITGANVLELKQERGEVTSVLYSIDNKPQSLPCDLLVSSIPLKDLGHLIFRGADSEFNNIVNTLQFRHLILVYIFIKRSLVLEDQWIFFPEKRFVFSRIFEQKQMNPKLCPDDETSICCDFTCSEDSWQWKANDEELMKKCVDGLIECGFIKAEEVSGYLVRRKKNFYPRYDLRYEDKMGTALDKLKQINNLLLTGRIGMYNYNNSDHCMDMGRFISERLESNIPCPRIIDEMQTHIKDYRIVD